MMPEIAIGSHRRRHSPLTTGKTQALLRRAIRVLPIASGAVIAMASFSSIPAFAQSPGVANAMPTPPLEGDGDDRWAFGHIDFDPTGECGPTTPSGWSWDTRSEEEWGEDPREQVIHPYPDHNCIPVTASQVKLTLNRRGNTNLPVSGKGMSCFSTLQKLQNGARRSAGFCIDRGFMVAHYVVTDSAKNGSNPAPVEWFGPPMLIADNPTRWTVAAVGYSPLTIYRWMTCGVFSPQKAIWIYFYTGLDLMGDGNSSYDVVYLDADSNSFSSIAHIWDGAFNWNREILPNYNVYMCEHVYFTPLPYLVGGTGCPYASLQVEAYPRYNWKMYRHWGFENYGEWPKETDMYYVPNSIVGMCDRGFEPTYYPDPDSYVWDICSGVVRNSPCIECGSCPSPAMQCDEGMDIIPRSTFPITWYVDTATLGSYGQAFIEAAEDASTMWNQALGMTALAQGPASGARIKIFGATSKAQFGNSSATPAQTIAVKKAPKSYNLILDGCSRQYNVEEALETHIKINMFNYRWHTACELRRDPSLPSAQRRSSPILRTVLHELGHVLDLRHYKDFRQDTCIWPHEYWSEDSEAGDEECTGFSDGQNHSTMCVSSTIWANLNGSYPLSCTLKISDIEAVQCAISRWPFFAP